MADRGHPPAAVSLPDDWPAHPDLSLALNRMGGFDWNLDSGLVHLDGPALEIFGLRPDEFDGDPGTLLALVPNGEAARLKALIAQALKEGAPSYGAYFRIRHADGSLRWTHTQAHIRHEAGRPRRIIGIVRSAEEELAQAALRNDADEGRRRLTEVVGRTTDLLALASSMDDVIAVLKDEQALGQLKAVSVMLGVIEGGRIRLVCEGRLGAYVPELRYTRIDERFPMSDVVRTQRPLFITSWEEFRTGYPLLWPHLERLSVGSAAYLPLTAQARPIGALGLLYPRHGEFSDDERNLLIALSSSIAQSLQRAMLYEQEHDLAEGLQQAMLPRRIPDVPGARTAVRYRSARMGRSVGGDWYDVLPLPGDRVGLTIGDVQGHDTDAAVVMGQLRMALWAYAAEGHPPPTALARASALLHELGTDRFATCTYAEVNLVSGALRIVRAGHLDPLLRHADGTCHWIPAAGGLPLGLSTEFTRPDEIGYPLTTGVLGPGETLLLFTDGLVEQPGIDLGERLDVLKEKVRTGPVDPTELADLLFDELGQESGEDDMALLLLRRDAAGLVRAPVTGRSPDGVARA
ncbi:SpoIIE family protein phosphatase [Streptomyces odonnellii]|uniref:SpoIIE family protein phosphatase n=1 Tax=Streptomyces odonnellii TaxID=1417980 RepID=UPI00099D0E1F